MPMKEEVIAWGQGLLAGHCIWKKINRPAIPPPLRAGGSGCK